MPFRFKMEYLLLFETHGDGSVWLIYLHLFIYLFACFISPERQIRVLAVRWLHPGILGWSPGPSWPYAGLAVMEDDVVRIGFGEELHCHVMSYIWSSAPPFKSGEFGRMVA